MIKIISSKTIEQQYQKKTPIEHILIRPDTYIGSIKIQKELMWIYSSEMGKIIEKDINFSPGLYKIFDEIIVNAGDRVQEDSTCNIIKVDINSDTNTISVWNNGLGIPVKIHKEHGLYVPSLVFGELLTGSNYDDDQDRITGGRNGYGAKLANIYSTFFSVETVDSDEKLKFYQEFKNNMSIKEEPKITKLKSESIKSYTSITFKPDLDRFGLSSLTSDIISLFEKRVYDMAGIYNHITVYLNDKKINFSNFKKYIELYNFNIPSLKINNENENDDNNTESSQDSKNIPKNNYEIIYEETSPRWKIGVIYVPYADFKQISFVNAICTYRGGTHVNSVVDNITDKIKSQIIKKHKDLIVKPSSIKENMIVFINSVIVNPSFSSQVKETLQTKVSDFGSSCEISDKFIKKIYASGIVDQVINLVKMKQDSLLKKTDGKKISKIAGIPKLEDANWAGTKKSNQCYLILTEGDSAKALAMAGLGVVGQDRFGVFPLKGKLLNVREANSSQIMKNEEIANIKKILGLQQGKKYQDKSELRYNGIIIMTDADVDGFHIKGLLINFIDFFWPSLVKTCNFIFALQTPIVKATRGKEILEFYNLTEYENWKNKINVSSYRIKYYKGLGTSTKEEAKEYFTGLEEKLLNYTYENISGGLDNIEVPEETENYHSGNTESIRSTKSTKKTTKNITLVENDSEEDEFIIEKIVTRKYNDDTREAITLAFEKDRSNDRKAWLMGNDKKKIIPQSGKIISIPNFINQELILFSYDDCDRSLPSVCDGLKPSQRKVLYGAFLKKIYTQDKEIRVSQLAAYVAEKTSYHHGEASVVGTIVKMAQDFVGSNNINVLVPSGTFGCLAPDTPIFLWDGSIINAEDIKIGHELIGDDGDKRVVKQITSGIDDMYEIINTKGNKLIVNSQHILTLYYADNNLIKWNETHSCWYFNYFNGKEIKTVSQTICKNLNDNNHLNKFKLLKENGYLAIKKKSEEIKKVYNTNQIIDIKLTDYLKLSTFAKKCMYMLSNLNNIKWPKKNIPIDPYIFGAWLGGIGITSDDEIIKSFAFWADTINAEISHFVKLLKENNLYKNKHIPNDYLINNEKTRLELLAGIIDTHGTIHNNGTSVVYVEISQSKRLHKILIEQIDFIAKSLGFVTSTHYIKKKTNMITLRIFGFDLDKIPIRIVRKKIIQLKREAKTEHFTKFDIKYIGKDKFCGWSIDGNERFLLGNFIVTHNSRLQGGSDHASARYIQTFITPEITRSLYKFDDDAILNYLDDDGQLIEPEWFIPILPMILVNGTKGIGTGFSTTVPKYSPKDIAENLIAMMDNKLEECNELTPWYKGFKGSILAANKPGSYLIYGKYQLIDDTSVRVTELPIGIWTDDYKQFLEEEIVKKKIISYTTNNTDENIEFTIIFDEDILQKLLKNKSLYKNLKLTSRISINNMYLYDPSGIIKKYNSPQDILNEFYQVRLDMYIKRKIWLLNKLNNEVDILKYKMKFIQYVLDSKIIVFKEKKSVIIDKLIELKFPKLAISNKKIDNEDNNDENINDDKSYEYITSMALFSLTEEKITELQEKLDNKQNEFKKIEATTEIDQWKLELNDFLDIYIKWSEIKQSVLTEKKITKSVKKTKKILNIV